MNSIFLFLSCFAALVLFPIYLPQYPLCFFLPFLIRVPYRGNLTLCLAAATVCGLIMDLLSSYLRLGLHSAAYTATMAIFWWIRRFFFFETGRLTPFLAMLFSSLSTFLLMGMGGCMGEMWIPEKSGWLKDVLLYSGLDSLYATLYLFVFECFTCKRSEPVFC